MSWDTKSSLTHTFKEGDIETSGGPAIILIETNDTSESHFKKEFASEKSSSAAGITDMEQLKKQIKSHEEKIRSHEEKIRCHEEKIRQLEIEKTELSAKNEDLSQMNQQLEDNIDKLRKELTEKINELKKDNDRLKEELQKCLTRLQESERGHDLLYINQAANLFERAICAKVLPAVFENNKFATIRQLLNYLNGDTALDVQLNTDEIRDANQNWAKVCDHLGLPDEWKTQKVGSDINWSDANVPKIIRAIYFLKESRCYVAHPPKISLKEAEQKLKSVAKDMTHQQYLMVQTLILQLKENIDKIGLQFSDEELIA